MRTLARYCKLCEEETVYQFSLPLVGGLQGDYFECRRCRMLQSYHLDSLSSDDLARFYRSESEVDQDVGAAWRQYCLVTRVEQLVRLRVLPRSGRGFKVLDYGGNSGFAAGYLGFRFGWDTRCYDPYAVPAFARDKFIRSEEDAARHGPYHLVIASEVFEHFTHPREQITRMRSLLAESGASVFVTTGRYLPGRRDRAWDYLAPQTGQHTCFYSGEAIREVGRLLGAPQVFQVGAEYEWLLVRPPAGSSWLAQTRLATAAALLRTGVSLGILRKIE